MYAVMSNFRNTTNWSRRGERVRPTHWRTPSLGWRQCFVGSLLAMPGTVGGLLLALTMPLELAPLFAAAGAFAGLYIGYKMEKR